MPSLCCFWDPKKEYVRDRTLEDECPDCGRTYGHPLAHPPDRVNDFEIVDVIDRGFYGAIYVGERGALRRKSVLKVVPRGVYEAFGKDFAKECRVHNEVASGTQHLVQIQDAFDADVRFEGEAEDLPCHIAVLDYVEGETLDRFLANPAKLTATAIAQIAVDLFRLLGELENKERFHNDLHGGNLLVRSLPREERRAEAIDASIVAVAVDLGSITDASRSHEEQQTGDLHQVAHHLLTLAGRLLDRPERGSDVEYRLATALQEIAQMLSPESAMQRTPQFEELIKLIYAAFDVASSPWKEPTGGLRSFDESYNAQTLRAWFVPQLLVDPAGWQAQLEAAGPQVITGMRGCGKTILLRSLQFHARASLATQRAGEDGAKSAAELLSEDGYVGLYVSCTRLLDRLGSPTAALHEPYARLFLVYAREAVRALRHLREIPSDTPLVTPSATRAITEAVGAFTHHADLGGIDSELGLERRLQQMQISLERGESHHTLLAHPTLAFPHLAEAVLSCSPLWASSRVYFLLDDVSTRHLHEEAIRDLISTLMFNHERCAFKVTTEAQTLELVLKSPGLVEEARVGRDYETFDLGAKINDRLDQDAGRAGRKFIAEVLRARARQFPQHPPVDPSEIVGDVSLEQIARTIGSTSKTAPEKKAVYHGMTALAALCVGDIGDVISIYEMILSKAGRVDTIPVDAQLQSTCFQEYCSRRLYHLNRRKGALKDFALGFAEASHELLMQSAVQPEDDGKRRLRQYTSVYVRVTSGDQVAQLDRLRELMDAGVFVLEAGPDAPRTKTRDSNPITQFVLTYRKLFGLSNFIGLSQRDRFELSGPDLEEWLSHPERTREILLRNLSGSNGGDDSTSEYSDESEAAEPPEAADATPTAVQTVSPEEATQRKSTRPRTLFEPPDDDEAVGERVPDFARKRMPRLTELRADDLGELHVETIALGRGFEERTLASAQRLSEALHPRHGVLVSYPLEGHGAEVEKVARGAVNDLQIVDYRSAVAEGLSFPPGLALVDVTGLAKPMIFDAVRRLLRRDGRVVVTHTAASVHYPLNDDIARVLDADEKGDAYELLDALSGVLTGEARPYTFDKLLNTDADDGRRRLLCAASSPKHERLMSLIDERDYDRVDIVVPASDTPRGRLSRLAAEVATKNFHSSSTVELPSDDLAGMLEFVADHYQRYYAHGNFDFELGLTGSKLHAVACATACSALRFSQCWYVRPAQFDVERFTQGVAGSRYFLLESPRSHAPAGERSPAAEATPTGF